MNLILDEKDLVDLIDTPSNGYIYKIWDARYVYVVYDYRFITLELRIIKIENNLPLYVGKASLDYRKLRWVLLLVQKGLETDLGTPTYSLKYHDKIDKRRDQIDHKHPHYNLIMLAAYPPVEKRIKKDHL